MAALQISTGPQPQESTGLRDRQKDQSSILPFPQGPESGREGKYIKSNELAGGIDVSAGCLGRTAADYRIFPSKVEKHF